MLLGVGLLLFAQDTGRIFVLKELKSKPLLRKEAGMLSFPLETVERGESKEDAMKRLLVEEVGIEELIHCPIYFCGTMEILKGVAYTIPAYAICKQEFQGAPADSDIEFFGWLTPSQLLERKIRVEVAPVLQVFLRKKRFGF